jgi:hypothetical protein
MDAVVHGPGEGERHGAGSSEILIKATGEDTDGSFFLSETTIAAGFPGPLCIVTSGCTTCSMSSREC